MKVLVLVHGAPCTILEPCGVCALRNHVRLSMTQEAFAVHEQLLHEVVIEVPELEQIAVFRREISTFEHFSITIKKKLEVAHLKTLDDLTKCTRYDLAKAGLPASAIAKLVKILWCHGLSLKT